MEFYLISYILLKVKSAKQKQKKTNWNFGSPALKKTKKRPTYDCCLMISFNTKSCPAVAFEQHSHKICHLPRTCQVTNEIAFELQIFYSCYLKTENTTQSIKPQIQSACWQKELCWVCMSLINSDHCLHLTLILGQVSIMGTWSLTLPTGFFYFFMKCLFIS